MGTKAYKSYRISFLEKVKMQFPVRSRFKCIHRKKKKESVCVCVSE